MTQIQVGIPQAMHYHEFGSLWTDFFKNMGIPVCTSGETSKYMLDRGTLLAIDESCLPLKVYLGHVDSLLTKCSHLFVPRLVEYHRNFYFCAKFAGLPDIVRNTFHLSSDKLISPNIEYSSSIRQFQPLYNTCRTLGLSPFSACFAYRQALRSWRTPPALSPAPTHRRIAIIGHNYLLKDAFFCRDIEKTLAAHEMDSVTQDQVASKTLYDEAKVFQPDIYWQLSAKIAGAAHFFCRQTDIMGVIMVSSFGCGPDSLVNEYIEHHVFKKSNKPILTINLDEHTGSAGLITRLEAFLDLIEWRQQA